MKENGRGGALKGLKVVEITQGQQGPVAAQIMADMGADVIKVEPPLTGEGGRHVTPTGTLVPLNPYFEMNNRGKKSITIDIRQERGKEIILKLAKKADILLWNFRPGVAEKRGLGWEELHRINPRLIYAVGSAWGLKGPHGKSPGVDTAAQATAGIPSTCGEEKDRLVMPKTPIADQTGAFLAALGAMIALYHREQTGEGQMVDTSLLGGQIALAGWAIQEYLFTGVVQPRCRSKIKASGRPNFSACFKARDGKSLLVQLVGNDKWKKGFKVLGVENILADPRFDTPQKVIKNQDDFHAILDKLFLTKDRDEWLKLMQENDIVSAPINDFADAVKYPDVLANEYVTEIDHPKAGRIKVVGIPFRFSKTPGKIGIAPELGQHNEEVLAGLGYSKTDIAKLIADKVVGKPGITPMSWDTTHGGAPDKD